MKKIILLAVLNLIGHAHLPAQIINTIAGNGTGGFSGDGGAATLAKIYDPHDMCMDPAGNLYFADWSNHRVRKVSVSGIITTIGGNGTVGFSGDGGPATAARLNHPYGITIDHSGNVYFSDEYNHRIRKITPSGIISTVAGTGTMSYSGDGGPATAANIWYPLYMGADAADNIYFADNQNQRIRKITPSGIISTVAGNGLPGYMGDGSAATAARLNYPGDMTFDASGNMYFCDGVNHCVRKVNTSGIISTVAGIGGIAGFSGDGGPATTARLNEAQCIALDNLGNIYISDYNNNRIRKVNASGIISTVVGTGTPLYNGDGISPTAANIDHPVGVWVNPLNDLYIADQYNQRIRKITPNNYIPYFTAGTSTNLTVCTTGVARSIDTALAVMDADAGQTLTWSIVTGPAHGSLLASYSATSTGSTVYPSGLSYTATVGYSGADMFQVRVYDGYAYDTITINVTVSSMPSAGTISGPATVCAGSAITLTTTGTAGAWISSASGTASVGAGSGIVSGVAGGAAVITYNASNVCGTAIATYPVSVTPLPSAGTISGPSNVCVGSTATLTSTVAGGTWSTSSGTATTGPSTGVVSGTSAGISIVTYSVSNACGTTTTTWSIAVVTAPVAGTISGASSLCAGSTITLTSTVPGGSWSATLGSASVGASTGVVYGVSAGADLISYTVSNACGSSLATFLISVDPLPDPGIISGVSSICAEQTITLSETVTGGTWSHTSSHVSILSPGVVGGVTAGPDTIVYTVSNPCGTASAIFPVVVNPLPDAGAISGIDTVCPGQVVTLSETATGGTWGHTTTSTSISTTGVMTGVASGIDTIAYTVTNICGTAVVKFPVYVKPSKICKQEVAGQQAGIICELFPNPSDGLFSIRLADEGTSSARITIRDISGRTLHTQEIKPNTTATITTNLLPGLYLVDIETETAHWCKKLTVVK